MTRLLKVATPFAALAVAVLLPPAKVPLLRVSVTEEVSLVTVLPLLSSTATVTAGLMAAPPVAVVGCWTKASFEAAPAVIVNALEVGPGRLGAVAGGA